MRESMSAAATVAAGAESGPEQGKDGAGVLHDEDEARDGVVAEPPVPVPPTAPTPGPSPAAGPADLEVITGDRAFCTWSARTRTRPRPAALDVVSTDEIDGDVDDPLDRLGRVGEDEGMARIRTSLCFLRLGSAGFISDRDADGRRADADADIDREAERSAGNAGPETGLAGAGSDMLRSALSAGVGLSALGSRQFPACKVRGCGSPGIRRAVGDPLQAIYRRKNKGNSTGYMPGTGCTHIPDTPLRPPSQTRPSDSKITQPDTRKIVPLTRQHA